MKPETKETLRAINKDVPSFLKQKTIEKLRRAKDPLAVYIACVELILIIGLVIALYVWENPDINFIPDQKLPFWAKTIVFLFFVAVTVLLFLYNKKFFIQGKGAKWVWRWKNK